MTTVRCQNHVHAQLLRECKKIYGFGIVIELCLVVINRIFVARSFTWIKCFKFFVYELYDSRRSFFNGNICDGYHIAYTEWIHRNFARKLEFVVLIFKGKRNSIKIRNAQSSEHKFFCWIGNKFCSLVCFKWKSTHLFSWTKS